MPWRKDPVTLPKVYTVSITPSLPQRDLYGFLSGTGEKEIIRLFRD